MSDYVAELHRLAQHCNYGDTLDKMLRDRIVWGIKNEPTHKKLLQVSDLNYAKTLTVAQGFETVERNLKEMHHAPTAEPVASASAGIFIKTEPVNKVSRRKASSTSVGLLRVRSPSVKTTESPILNL